MATRKKRVTKTWKLSKGDRDWDATDGNWLCDDEVRKFWWLGTAKRIYLTLTNQPARESYRAELVIPWIQLDGWKAGSTFQ